MDSHGSGNLVQETCGIEARRVAKRVPAGASLLEIRQSKAFIIQVRSSPSEKIITGRSQGGHEETGWIVDEV